MTKVDLTQKIMRLRREKAPLEDETLGEVKKAIDYFIGKYGEDACLALEENYGAVESYIEYSTLETDEEYKHRLSAMKRQEIREKEQYKKLKAKYG